MPASANKAIVSIGFGQAHAIALDRLTLVFDSVRELRP